jgi:sarcosine oxidase, subunit alpha
LRRWKTGRSRIGQTGHFPIGGALAPAQIAEPVVFDPEGARRDG